MKILLTCTECSYAQWGSTEKPLMNKIIMWNHVQKSHTETAERIMRMYQMVPNNFYDVHAPEMAVA